MSRKLLHVGCGHKKAVTRPDVFRSAEWREIRLDIAAVVRPDIVGDIEEHAEREGPAVYLQVKSCGLE